jgi:hypothetical protein
LQIGIATSEQGQLNALVGNRGQDVKQQIESFLPGNAGL